MIPRLLKDEKDLRDVKDGCAASGRFCPFCLFGPWLVSRFKTFRQTSKKEKQKLAHSPYFTFPSGSRILSPHDTFPDWIDFSNFARLGRPGFFTGSRHQRCAGFSGSLRFDPPACFRSEFGGIESSGGAGFAEGTWLARFAGDE